MFSRPIAIYFNPISGKGEAPEHAARIEAVLRAEGYAVESRESSTSDTDDSLSKFFERCELAIICGGDGTLCDLLPAIARTQIPIYMAPSGNESLFAKEFLMSREPGKILRAIKIAKVETHQLGKVGPNFFVTMASVGLDSLVIKRIAHSRTGPIGDLGYVWPTLREALGYRPPVVNLKVDGVQVVDNQPGFLIIANTKQYAKRMNFVPEANSQSGKLHARFFPDAGLGSHLRWFVKGVLAGNIAAESPRCFSGTKFELDCKPAFPIQADGEHVGQTPAIISTCLEKIRIIVGGAKT